MPAGERMSDQRGGTMKNRFVLAEHMKVAQYLIINGFLFPFPLYGCINFGGS